MSSVLTQRRSFYQFRDNEVSVINLSNFVDREYVRMVQSEDRPGFPLKTTHSFVVFGEVGKENLKRNPAAESGIFGDVNFSHATSAELLSDSITTKLLTDYRVTLAK